MQRLFSSFAGGWPGAGLCLLRVLIGGDLIYHGIAAARSAEGFESALALAAAGAGGMLVVGLYTPVAGVAAAALELWIAFSNPGQPWSHIRLAGVLLCVAMIGPGAWSIDARLFGRKQMDLSRFEKESGVPRKW